MKTIRRCGISLAASFALALLLAVPALGSTHIWTGSANGLWSNAGNWSGGKPTSNEAGGTIVQFGSNTSSTMDIAGLTVEAIEFTGSNNTIAGSTGLTINDNVLTDNIVSDGEGNALASTLPITLAAAEAFAVSKAGMLTIASPIGGPEALRFIGQGGNLALNGTNTFTGTTTIQSGALHIATFTGDVIVGPELIVGTGSGTGAELVLDQDNDISTETAVTVNHEGTINFQGDIDNAKSLTVHGGRLLNASMKVTNALTMEEGSIALAGIFAVGSLNMKGGGISGTGPLELSGNLEATSTPSGPATISSPLELNANPTITVNSGGTPGLDLSGPITQTGGSRGFDKAGAGTMRVGGANTYTGATTVAAGTLQLTGGSPSSPFTVEQNGTMSGSGTVGATTVAGTLTPAAPGLNTGALSFAATGRLDDTIASAAAEAVPSLLATGTVAINPSATMNLVVEPGIALHHGASVTLIGNDASDPIEGQFNGFPTNDLLSTLEGVPLALSYAGGDGNDMTLTAANVPPQVGSIAATLDPVEAGKPITLSVTASDANQDPLTTSWNFGDGTTANGPSVSHAFAKAGSYTIVATVSDGLAQVQSTTIVTVTAAAGSSIPASTSTVHASAYGATFAFVVPSVCVRPGASFTVVLSVKKPAKGKLSRVTKVSFAINGKSGRTDRSAPYRARLALPHGAKSGSSLKVRVKALLMLRGGKHQTKSLTASVKAC